LIVNEHIKTQARSFLKNLSDDDYEFFIENNINNPDQITMENSGDGGLHYNGIPYDVELFRSSKFRVVSETTFDTHRPFVTEKTYMTILNNLPFIIAGDVGILDFLESQGFQTYRSQLKIPDYADIIDPESRLDAIVANTRHWLEHGLDENLTKEITKNNYQNFIGIAQYTQQTLEHIIKTFRLSTDNLDDLCPTDFYYRNW
jgi:hypothetical protein